MIMSLRGIHENELARQSGQDDADARTITEFGAPIARNELAIRAVGLRDRGFEDRLGWIARWARPADSWQYRADDMRYMCQGEASFTALLVHGEDVRRMGIIARKFREIYRSKALLAVCTPGRRASMMSLFASGFDDILDLAMDPCEAAARLRAHVRRLQRGQADGLPVADGLPEILGDLGGLRFSPSERRILATLARRPGHTVEYEQLLQMLRRGWGLHAVRALQVAVHHLRHKLPPSLRIETVRATGYILHIA